MFRVHARHTVFVLVLLIVLAGAGMAAGELPQKINYQGRLSDSSTGEALDGSHDMVFRIYDAAEGGAELWSEPVTALVDSSGVFSVILGGMSPITIPFENPVWLEVEVGGEVLTPRREVVSVPYAFRARAADHAADSDSLGGYGADAFADTGHTHHRLAAPDGSPAAAVYVDEDGNVGIGTSGPEMKLDVNGGPVRSLQGIITGPADYGVGGVHIYTDGGFASPLLRFTDQGGTGESIIAFHDSSGSLWHMRVGEAFDIKDASTGQLRLRVSSAGNLGVGVADPTEKLQVDGVVYSVTGGFRFPDGSLQATAATGASAGGGWVDDDAVVRLEDSADSVGIGTGAPQEKLDVAGTVRVGGFVMPDDSVFGYILTSDSTGTGTWQLPVADGHSLDDAAGTIEDVVYVDNGGDVGLGTIDPATKLHVYEDANAPIGITIENPNTGSASAERITFKDEQGGIAAILAYDPDNATSPNGLRIFNNRPGGNIGLLASGGAYDDLYIDDIGRVGIHTSSPQERLDVDGTARMTGFNLPTGAADGHVLISDATGTGTWQAAPGGDGYSLDGAGGSPGDAVYVDAMGDVGVGTTSPDGDIHLHRNINGPTKVIVENLNIGESSTESLVFADENGEAAGITLTDDGFAPRPRNMRIFNDRPLGNMSFSTNGARRMSITSTGSVGIGTSNPLQELVVEGETGVWATINATGSNSIAGLGLSNDVNSWEIDVRGDFGDALIIRDNSPGNNRMVIDDNGNVGFNTTTPANALHLNKTSATSCNLQITNGSTGSASGDGLRLGVDNLRNAYVVNEENTNLYMGSNGDIDFTVASDGDVGIGTNSPTSSSLQIYRSGASTCNIKLTNGTTGPLSGDGLNLGIGTTGDAYISNGENTALSLSTNGTTRLRVAADGKVGIGETSPSSLLDLKGSDPYIDLNTTNAVAGLRLQKNGTTKWEVAWNEGSGYMYLWSGGGAGTSVVVEDATGDVGIGTSSPTSRVHINGANGYSQLRLEDSYTPTGTSDPNGNTGDIAWDTNYFYVKTGAGWKRASLSTF